MTKVPWFFKHGIKITDIEAGGRHTLAISDEDTEPDGKAHLYGWGFGYYFQLGQGNAQREDATDPVEITLKSNQPVTQISCGYFHSCAITR